MRVLLGAEIRRLVARRVVGMLAFLVVAVSAVAGVLVFANHGSVSEAELDARRQAAREQVDACLEGEIDPGVLPPGAQFGPEGPEGPGGRVPPEFLPEFCRSVLGQVDDPRFRLADLPGILKGTTAPLVILATVIGATAIGADWQSRALTTLLTWEPRRTRVMMAKTLALAVVVLGFTLLAQAVISGALLPSAVFRGTTEGTGGEWVRALGGTLGRGSLAAVVFAVLGFAGASAAKSTAAVLGAAFGYVVVIEQTVGGFLEDWRPWLLLGNTIVWVSGTDGGGEVTGRSVVGAGLYLVFLAVGATMLATIAFRERDVG